MKHLSVYMLPAMLMLSGNGFPHKPSAPATVQTLYYWYTYPDDTYNDRLSTNDEINEMWNYYGTLVNTNPAGGVLIDRGYTNNAYPHNNFPAVYLYSH